jgi:hypothetical protein
VHAQDDHPGPGRDLPDLAHGGGRLPAGNLDVEQDDVGALAGGGRDRVGAVARLPDHLHVVLRLEDPAQPLADEHVVVHEQDPGAVVNEH